MTDLDVRRVIENSTCGKCKQYLLLKGQYIPEKEKILQMTSSITFYRLSARQISGLESERKFNSNVFLSEFFQKEPLSQGGGRYL